MNKDKFKIFIKADTIPIIDNSIIKYIEDDRKNRLFSEIYKIMII